jgi:hypothetical protein
MKKKKRIKKLEKIVELLKNHVGWRAKGENKQ